MFLKNSSPGFQALVSSKGFQQLSTTSGPKHVLQYFEHRAEHQQTVAFRHTVIKAASTLHKNSPDSHIIWNKEYNREQPDNVKRTIKSSSNLPN
jgi:hypothetical protein